MSISDSVSAALKKASLKQNDLAAAYGKSKQSMSMKFTRDSWFGKDLVKVAERVSNTAFTLAPRSVTTIVFFEE